MYGGLKGGLQWSNIGGKIARCSWHKNMVSRKCSTMFGRDGLPFGRIPRIQDGLWILPQSTLNEDIVIVSHTHTKDTQNVKLVYPIDGRGTRKIQTTICSIGLTKRLAFSLQECFIAKYLCDKAFFYECLGLYNLTRPYMSKLKH